MRSPKSFGPPKATTQLPLLKVLVIKDLLEKEGYQKCLPEDEEVELTMEFAMATRLRTKGEKKP